VADKDKPSITAPSESVEIPTNPNRPMPDAVPFRTSGKEPDAVRISGDDPLPSRASRISRAPAPASSMLGGSAGFGSQSASEAAANMRESIQRTARMSVDRDHVRDNPPPPPPRMPTPPLSDPLGGQPMHPRDRRLYVILAWTAIPAALFAGCFIAWGSGQLPGSWAIVGMLVGIVGMAIGTVYALEKKAPLPRSPGPIMFGIAVLTWLLIGWQTWLYSHSPVQGYTRAQLDKAVEEGKAQAIVTATAQLRSELGGLKRDLENPSSPDTSLQKGPIAWNLGSQFLVASSNGASDLINGIFLQGTSTASIGFKEAYAVSGLTGHRQELMANVPYKGYYPVGKVDIPPHAPVQLDMVWNPPFLVRDFMGRNRLFRRNNLRARV